MIIPLDGLRYEIKFVVPVTESYRLSAWVRQHPSAYDQRLVRSPNRTARANLPDVMVLEAKTDSSHFEELGEVISTMPSRVGRFSKYISGLQTILTAS